MKTEHSGVVADHVTSLGLEMLHPHPRNPRRKAGSLAGLCESLKAQGQLEPILVRRLPAGGYEILAGHRRVEALRTNGELYAMAIVREVPSDAEALSILLAANEQREDVDPWLEAEAVRELVKLEGTVKAAAARMGVAAAWVAQRLSLLELSPAWVKRRGETPWSSWSPAHWAVIARLSADAQEQLAEKRGDWRALALNEPNPTVSELEEVVREHLRPLGKAPFDIHSSALLRDVGACSNCPKTSQSVPGLFDDGEPVDVLKATCRDSYCWGRKAAASMRAKVTEARTKLQAGPTGKPADVLVVAKDPEAPKGAGAMPAHRWTPVPKGTKGAVPVVVVSKSGAVSTGFGKIKPKPKPYVYRNPNDPPENETPVARLKRLEEKHAHDLRNGVIDELVEIGRKLKLGDRTFRQTLALVLLLGAELDRGVPNKKSSETVSTKLGIARLLADDNRDVDESVIAAALLPMVTASADEWSVIRNTAEGDFPLMTRTLAAAVGVTPEDLEKLHAKLDKPSPELAAARDAVAGPPAPPAKGKRAKGKAAAAGDDDAADVDAAPPAKPSAPKRSTGKKPNATDLRKLAGKATPR